MSKILNTLLCALFAFLLSFLWIVYCLKEAQIAAWLSLVIAICCGYLVFRAEKAWDVRRRVKRNKTKQIGNLRETLRYGTDNSSLFEDMLSYYRFATSKVDCDNLIVSKNGKRYFVALRFVEDVLRGEIVHATINTIRQGCDRLLLFGCKADQTALKNATKYVEVQFVDIANTYELLEKANKIPTLVQKFHPISPILPNMLCRRRFGLYFVSSLFMLVVSAVAFFPWYTLAWATVSFVLALYSLLNKRYNTLPTQITLD